MLLHQHQMPCRNPRLFVKHAVATRFYPTGNASDFRTLEHAPQVTATSDDGVLQLHQPIDFEALYRDSFNSCCIGFRSTLGARNLEEKYFYIPLIYRFILFLSRVDIRH